MMYGMPPTARFVPVKMQSRLLWFITLVVALAPDLALAEELGRQVFVEDPSGKALTGLHQALRRAKAGKGRARLLFYGDSHTAEDQYTGFLRMSLQKRFGDGGPGFVLPYPPFPHYAHQKLHLGGDGPWEVLWVRGRKRTRDRYGLAGVALRARKAAWARIDVPSQGPSGDEARRFVLFYGKGPRGGSFDLVVNGTLDRRVSTSSRTHETAYETGRGVLRRLEIRTAGDGPVRIFGVSVEHGDGGVIVDALGIPGGKGRDQLPWDEAVHRAHLEKIAPSLIALEYGTNESGGDLQSMQRYERDLRAVLSRLRRLQPETSCLLIGPSEWPERRPDGSYRHRSRTTGILGVQRRVAPDFECGFFDLLAFQGGPGSMVRWVNHDPPLALTDHVHFTDEGHQRLAQVFERALLHGM